MPPEFCGVVVTETLPHKEGYYRMRAEEHYRQILENTVEELKALLLPTDEQASLRMNPKHQLVSAVAQAFISMTS